MWALLADWAANNKSLVVMSATAVTVIGLLAGALSVQTIRVQAAQADAKEARAETRELRVELDEAIVAAEKRALAADALVRAEYEQSIESDADVVGRAVARARAQCMPNDTRGKGDSGMPDTRAVADEPAGQSSVDRDRAFGAAVAADLEICARELTRFRALQAWVIHNSKEIE